MSSKSAEKNVRGRESNRVRWSMNPNEREWTEVVKEETAFGTYNLLTGGDDRTAHKSRASSEHI